ncbi:MAG TPA: Mu-like prophage major head subunit gpT family protein, partial [Tepidisphaeraceae bacterium]|nr:Mu-like prophage major head subunit gpT family protein [Tepidisphaeraceae bacterium]
YAILTANAALSDTVALFHDASHGNLTSGTDAPTVATLGVNRAKMMKQTGPGGGYLNIKPATLIVPAELLTTAEQLVASLVDPSKSNDTMNPFRNLSVVGEARLSANSATRWYLAADPRVIDTVEVAFLSEQPAPLLEQEDAFRTDVTSFKVRHVVAAKALEYRGLLRNGS